MKALAGLYLLLLAGCCFQPEQTGRHISRVEAVIINPHAYSTQAIILACIVIISVGLIHYWYRTKGITK